MGNHLVLTVDQLPSEANPSGVWYVDTGLGDALHDPLPLAAGRHDQPPFRLTRSSARVPGYLAIRTRRAALALAHVLLLAAVAVAVAAERERLARSMTVSGGRESISRRALPV